MPTVAIIVLNWKQPQLTLETVDSLLKIENKKQTYHIYIVDNGSTDDSIAVFKTNYIGNKKVSIIETGQNLGYVGGNNFGIKRAISDKFDWILLINNDVLVKKDFLDQLIIESDNKTFILGPKIYFAPGHEFHKNRYKKDELGNVIWSAGGHIDWNNIIGSNVGVDFVDNGQFDKVIDNYDFLTGCCLLVHSNVFKTIGYLDEKYFMYLEDADFCRRAVAHNFTLKYVPKSVIWHINAGSSSSGGSLHDYFLTRNRLLFGMKYASNRTKFALFRESMRTLFFSNSKWQKIGVFDFYIKKLGKGSW